MPTPPMPNTTEMDEDAQLQLALSLSKAEHQQEQRSREGEETLLRKALEESRREVKGGGVESAMKDLADIFGPGAAASQGSTLGNPWDVSATWAKPANVTSDPWDSLGDRSTSPVIDSSWMGPPAGGGPLKPWDPSQPPPDPWDAPRGIPSGHPTIHAGSSGVDPFCTVAKESHIAYDCPRLTLSRSGSPTDGDLFGEPVMGAQVNGREESSLEPFDLTRLREGLLDPTPRTPESFLDPTVASLVNLDSLIPINPPAKTSNPFLTELSAPTTSNPFQTTSSPPSCPPPSLTPPAFPPPQGLLDVLPNLPQPLLPLSAAPPPGQLGDQQAQNPFLVQSPPSQQGDGGGGCSGSFLFSTAELLLLALLSFASVNPWP
ncbi:hypothetical protein SKAU_G00295880 [Synaphobranchus kaupii]|uniref:Uncharacterized protein n=1 Tax=Synaphobranchus kaupii TaxID=118154 RepID=A0A9Q1EUT6_SYNKA|nr:hypothetical protein SKAU_G00295880 [Synaphobranchus kaupii]